MTEEAVREMKRLRSQALLDLLYWLATDSGIELDGQTRDNIGALRQVLDDAVGSLDA